MALVLDSFKYRSDIIVGLLSLGCNEVGLWFSSIDINKWY